MKTETKRELMLWVLIIAFVGSMLLLFGCGNYKYTTSQRHNYKSEKHNPNNNWK